MNQVCYFAEGLGIQRVVHPSAVPPIDDESGVLQHLEVEGKPGLSGVQCVGQVTDAALPKTKALKNGEAGLV